MIIPAFNYAQYVGIAIASVQQQTFSDWELIVVDDGSTDNTASVVSSITDTRFRCLHQPNAGLSAARNAGIAAATGELIAFLDADDLWHPDFLQRACAKFDEPGAVWGLVAARAGRIDDGGNRLPAGNRDHRYRTSGEMTARDFCLRNWPLSSSLAARREIFTECGVFDTSLRSSEDRDMWIRATMRYRCWLIGEDLALIRRHPLNMSKNAPRMERNSRATLVRAWRRGAVPRGDIVFWLQSAAVHCVIVAWTHLDAGYVMRAFGYLALSVVLWPVFLNLAAIREPQFFRLRAFVHFVRRVVRTP